MRSRRPARAGAGVVLVGVAGLIAGLLVVAQDTESALVVIPILTVLAGIVALVNARVEEGRNRREQKRYSEIDTRRRLENEFGKWEWYGSKVDDPAGFSVKSSLRPNVPFIERDAQARAEAQLRDSERLLIVGPPSCGKSRLLMEICEKVAGEHALCLDFDRYFPASIADDLHDIGARRIQTRQYIIVITESSVRDPLQFESVESVTTWLVNNISPRPLIVGMLGDAFYFSEENDIPHIVSRLNRLFGEPVPLTSSWSNAEMDRARPYFDDAEISRARTEGIPAVLSGESQIFSMLERISDRHPHMQTVINAVYWWRQIDDVNPIPHSAIVSLTTLLSGCSPSEAETAVDLTAQSDRHGLSILRSVNGKSSIPHSGRCYLLTGAAYSATARLGLGHAPRIVWVSVIQVFRTEPHTLVRIARSAIAIEFTAIAKAALALGVSAGSAECMLTLAALLRADGEVEKASRLERASHDSGYTLTLGIAPLHGWQTDRISDYFATDQPDRLYETLRDASELRSLTLVLMLESYYRSTGSLQAADNLRDRAESIVASRKQAVTDNSSLDEIKYEHGLEWFLGPLFDGGAE